jgi:glycosyltransferase involved in cell wall biosynthesis
MSVSLAAPRPRLQAPAAAQVGSVAIYMHDLAGGGVERQTLIIAEALRQAGIGVTLVLHRLRGPLLSQLPPDLRVVDLNSPRTLGDIPRLVRFLRREKPDLLLSNLDANNVAALLAKALGFSSTAVVICQHNPISRGFAASRLYRHVSLAYRLLAPLVSRSVAVSDGVAGELHRIAGLPAACIRTIHNPVVGPDFPMRSLEAAEHKWFGQPGRPVFVTAGRLVAQKDHETLLQALALHRRHANSRLIILGSGALRGRLGCLAKELGLADAVDFAGFQQNPLPFFREADAFVLSSRYEGFGNVLVEALGCGTPVIATSCAHGPAEILADGLYGVLVEPGNAAALAASMDQVATLRDRFPAAALRRRAADFSYAACAARYIDLFRAIAPHRAWAA